MIVIIENDIISKEYPLLCETDKKGIENFCDFTAQKSVETFIPSITLENTRAIFFEPENNVSSINIEKNFVWINPERKFKYSELSNHDILIFMDCLEKHKKDFFGFMDEFYFKPIKDRSKGDTAFIISKSPQELWRGINHLPKMDVLYFDSLQGFIDEVCTKMEYLSENWLVQNNYNKLFESACEKYLIDCDNDDYYQDVEYVLVKSSEYGTAGDFEIDTIFFNKLPAICDIKNLEIDYYKADKLFIAGEFTAELEIQFHMNNDEDEDEENESSESLGELLTEEYNHDIEFSDDGSATLEIERTFKIAIEITNKEIDKIWLE